MLGRGDWGGLRNLILISYYHSIKRKKCDSILSPMVSQYKMKKEEEPKNNKIKQEKKMMEGYEMIK